MLQDFANPKKNQIDCEPKHSMALAYRSVGVVFQSLSEPANLPVLSGVSGVLRPIHLPQVIWCLLQVEVPGTGRPRRVDWRIFNGMALA